MREKRVEQALVNKIVSLGGLCLKWVSPGHTGVPDRICILPGGRVVFFELKAPGARLGKIQEATRRKLEELGQIYFVADSIEAVEKYTERLREEVIG